MDAPERIGRIKCVLPLKAAFRASDPPDVSGTAKFSEGRVYYEKAQPGHRMLPNPARHESLNQPF